MPTLPVPTGPIITGPRLDLLGLSLDEFTFWSRSVIGHAPRFHHDLYRRLMKNGHFSPAESPLWQEAERTRPGTLATLAAAATSDQVPPVSGSSTADDPELGLTTKVLCRLHDGHAVESVAIPMAGMAGVANDSAPRAAHHYTACVSSQVGCRMGCTFCHTARMGLIRSLRAYEIVAQVLAVQRATGIPPRNVVFMGMGEPLDNIHEVAAAIRVLTDPGGLAIRHRHLCISTVGRADILAQWVALGLSRVNLAVSLTAADDQLRTELMPVNRLHPLAELRQTLERIPVRPGRHILLSCVVIPGVTDSPAQVTALTQWVRGLPAMINLIPYNPIPSRSWRAPTWAEIERVRTVLAAAGLAVRVRLTKGDAVMAACGQLGDPGQRFRRSA